MSIEYPEGLKSEQTCLIMMIGLRLGKIECELSGHSHWSFIRRHRPKTFRKHQTQSLEVTHDDLLSAGDRIPDVNDGGFLYALTVWFEEVDRLWDIAAASLFHPCQVMN